MPKLSIIMPVYNTEQYLNKCIDSILEQTYQDFELIIVSDCSPGNCTEIVNGYNDSRIKYIKLEKNIGLFRVRREGAQHATGEYLLHVDSDDFLLHENVLADLMPQIKDADILVFMYQYINENGSIKPMFQRNICYDKTLNSNHELFFEIFYGGVSNTMHSKIIKRSLWEKSHSNSIDQHIGFFEDFFALIPLAYHSTKTITTSYEGYGYYLGSNGLARVHQHSKEKLIKTLKDLIFIYDWIENFFKEKNISELYGRTLQERRHSEHYMWLHQYVYQYKNDPEVKELIEQAFYPWCFYDNIKDELKEQQTKDSTYFLTIIIPVFNTEPYLRRCLDSILAQKFTNYEIIVIDDRSPGNCEDIIDSYNHDKITYVKNPVNMGSAWSRLYGLSLSSGKYVYFVDSDDWLVKGSLSKIAKNLSHDYDVLQFNSYIATEDQSFESQAKYSKDYILKDSDNTHHIFDLLFVNNSISKTLWSSVFERKVAISGAIEMPPQWISIAEGEWLLNLLILWHAKSFKSVNDHHYCLVGNSEALPPHSKTETMSKIITPEQSRKYLTQIKIILNTLEQFLRDQGVSEQYKKQIKEIRGRDNIKSHILPMAKGLQAFFLHEIQENPENALRELRNMTHHPLNTIHLLQSIELNREEIGVKGAGILLIQKIKKHSEIIGAIMETALKMIYRTLKIFRSGK